MLYEAGDIAVSKPEKRNKRISGSFGGRDRSGFGGTKADSEKTGRRNRYEAALANELDAGSRFNHSDCTGVFINYILRRIRTRRIRMFWNTLKNDEGIGVVEVILILVVLIGLVIIFKSQLTDIVNSIFKKIVSESSGI